VGERLVGGEAGGVARLVVSGGDVDRDPGAGDGVQEELLVRRRQLGEVPLEAVAAAHGGDRCLEHGAARVARVLDRGREREEDLLRLSGHREGRLYATVSRSWREASCTSRSP